MSYLKLDYLLPILEEKTGRVNFSGDGRDIICRCPHPGCEIDLNKHLYGGKLYIDTVNPCYHCFRCEAKGSIFKLFNMIGIDINQAIDREVLDRLKYTTIKKDSSNATSIINKLQFTDELDDLEYEKYSYITSRIGDLNINSIPNLVYNMDDFVKLNKLQIDKKQLDYVHSISRDCIGFIGNRGLVATMRSIYEHKYYKIQLTPEKGNFKDFYGVPTAPIENDNINQIVVGEGAFDILGAMNVDEFKPYLSTSCMWACCLGSGFSATITSIADYLKLPRVKVIILADRDKNRYNSIYKTVIGNPIVQDVKVYWNMTGHDFGEMNASPGLGMYLNDIIKRRKNKYHDQYLNKEIIYYVNA